MRVIIAGSRDLYPSDEWISAEVKASGFEPVEIITGGAPGVDTCAKDWAERRGIPSRVFHAHWKEYGKAAGPIRNQQMAEYAHALIAFPGGRGTANMIREAHKRGLSVHISETLEHGWSQYLKGGEVNG